MKDLKLNAIIAFAICFLLSLLLQIGLDDGGNYGIYISIALICGLSASGLSLQIEATKKSAGKDDNDKSKKWLNNHCFALSLLTYDKIVIENKFLVKYFNN